MEKKLAVIVDNKEITTEDANTEMCSSACDVAMETCSSQSHDAYRMLCALNPHKIRIFNDLKCGKWWFCPPFVHIFLLSKNGKAIITDKS